MSRYRSLLIGILLSGISAADVPGQTPAKTTGTPTPSPRATAEPSATPTTRALIDSMDAADLKEAIQLLKNNYIKPENLSETELSRAAFEGVLSRLGRGVVLLSSSAAEPPDAVKPFFGEILDGHV